jgi:uncharacterized protein (TIGR03067 family)
MTLVATIEFPTQLEAPTDLERLQGTWMAVSGRQHVEFVVSDYLFAMRFRDGETCLGTFRLGPQCRPKTMDMRIDEGPARYRGKIARCIYELDGDTLRWCPAEPGNEQRPSTFPSATDMRFLCLEFRRQDPSDTI